MYDLVGRVATSGIPGVKKPMDCHRICMNIEDCQFWTYDTDDEGFFDEHKFVDNLHVLRFKQSMCFLLTPCGSVDIVGSFQEI